MVGLVLPVHYDVITDIHRTWDFSELLTDDILEDFTSRICSKIQSGVSKKTSVSCKGGNVATFLI